jgi:hypothetical protein
MAGVSQNGLSNQIINTKTHQFPPMCLTFPMCLCVKPAYAPQKKQKNHQIPPMSLTFPIYIYVKPAYSQKKTEQIQKRPTPTPPTQYKTDKHTNPLTTNDN